MAADKGSIRRFAQLSTEEQARYISTARELVRLAQRYAIPIMIAPPPAIGGEVNGATGCLLQLGSGWFIVTASHVLGRYEKRLKNESRLNWQVGALAPIDPLPSISWRNIHRDIVFLRVSEEQARAACGYAACIASPLTGWPPPVPKVGEVVLVAGYPRTLREINQSWIGAGPYSAMFRVTSIGDGYFYCQIEHEELISFDGGPLPAPSSDLGGLSGGPVLLMGTLACPLVGIVSEHHQGYDLLRIATLNGIDGTKLR